MVDPLRSASAPQGFSIADSQGGVLALDLSAPNIEAFAEACRLLAHGPLPSGATVITVRLGQEAYVLSRHVRPDGATEIHLANLYRPASSIRVSPELARVVAALVEEGLARRHAS
jgi:hypothetical protein